MNYTCPQCQATYLFQPEICPSCAAQLQRRRKQQRAQERRGSYDPQGKVNEAEFWQLLKLYSACPCCNTPWPETNGVARDHIVPLSRGGLNILANLQPLCNRCNLWKSAAIIYFDRHTPGRAAALPQRLHHLATAAIALVDAEAATPQQLDLLNMPTTPVYPSASAAELEAETLRLSVTALPLLD